MDALDALRRGRERGGNQMVTVDRADNDTRVQAYDQVWVKHIKAALMENRFRLVQQPIASLGGGNAEDVRRRDPHARYPGQGSAALGVPAGRELATI